MPHLVKMVLFCKSDVRVDEYFNTVLNKDQNTDFFVLLLVKLEYIK